MFISILLPNKDSAFSGGLPHQCAHWFAMTRYLISLLHSPGDLALCVGFRCGLSFII